jgi:hypothetical protein
MPIETILISNNENMVNARLMGLPSTRGLRKNLDAEI